MTTLYSRAACISLMALCAAYTPTVALHAQSAPTGQATAGGKDPCGIPTWSISEQRQTVMPCASSTSDMSMSPGTGKEACTMLTWSQADQRHMTMPCEASNKGGLPAPVHFGE